jgi:hypothetical protein
VQETRRFLFLPTVPHPPTGGLPAYPGLTGLQGVVAQDNGPGLGGFGEQVRTLEIISEVSGAIHGIEPATPPGPGSLHWEQGLVPLTLSTHLISTLRKSAGEQDGPQE